MIDRYAINAARFPVTQMDEREQGQLLASMNSDQDSPFVAVHVPTGVIFFKAKWLRYKA